MFDLIGKSIKIFEELDSTNNFVKMNASNLDNGAIIVAEMQTKGRGQRDNTWISKKGNLYFSIILKEGVQRDNVFKHIVQSSLAIIETLNHFKIDAMIKYPNDCLVDNKKISGVLIESLGSKKIDYIVIGIGLNVNQVIFDELSNKATSMKLKLERDIEVRNVLQILIKKYNEILEINYNDLFDEYLKSSVVINKSVKIMRPIKR